MVSFRTFCYNSQNMTKVFIMTGEKNAPLGDSSSFTEGQLEK